MLNRVQPQDVEYFRGLIPAERLLVGADIGSDYSHDELEGVHRSPDLVIRAISTEEVSRVLAYANKRCLPVVTRGSGTGLVGGAVAIEGGILLETTLMNAILELDERNFTVTVQAGVLLMDLSKYVEERGFFYPPDPGEKSATLGGNISTNAGGMRAVKYGVTRDYVLALRAVLPDGSVEVFGGKVVKNSSGYSLKDLLIGAEGTLAVITEATLRLLPLPAENISLLCPFPSFHQAIAAVPELLQLGVDPTAVEFFTRDVIALAEDFLGKRFPKIGTDAALLLTFDGSDAAEVEARSEKAARLCLTLGAPDVFIVDTDERKSAVWSARGAFLEAIKAGAVQMDECDVVVPRANIIPFVERVEQLSRELDMRIPYFGHAGDGNLHIYLCRDGLSKDAFEQKLGQGFAVLYEKAAELGGMVSGEHGIGWAKRGYLEDRLGPLQVALMARVKAAFDSNGILNPHKVCT